METFLTRLASLAGPTTVIAACLIGCGHSPPPAPAIATTAATATGHERDFEWLVGHWSVRHHRLKERLAGCTEWEDFAGTSTEWPTMGGLGTADDNVIELPSGAYRAMGVRAFDPKTEEWLIWWHDGRTPSTLDPPCAAGSRTASGRS